MARRKSQSKRSSGGKKKSAGRSAFLLVVGAVLVAMCIVYWQNAGVVNKTVVLEKDIAPTLKTFEIKDQDLVEKKVEKREIEKKRYMHKEKVYKAPETFSIKKFDEKLKKDLDKTEFKITKAKKVTARDTETYHATINYGKYDVMDIKVVKPRPAPPKVAPPPPPPMKPAEVKRLRGRLAIVLDDWGYTMNNIALLASIKEPLTLAVIPNLPYSTAVARGAKGRGYQVILHLPLESVRKDVAEEADTIKLGMSDAVINARLQRDLRSVPGAIGVNNHQGSKGTSERETMTPIMGYLKHNNLFFLDSMTTPRSVCRDVAGVMGVPFARRDVFLDNSNSISDIEKQILLAEQAALKKGRAVAIGHDRKNTLLALQKMLPKLKEDGIEIVPLSEVVK